jgi:hypothetical protein
MISFDPILAKKYGLHEAIILERFKILQEKNKENFQLYFEQKHWCEINDQIYNQFFYFMNRTELEYALENLKNRDVIDIKCVLETTVYSTKKPSQDTLLTLL